MHDYEIRGLKELQERFPEHEKDIIEIIEKVGEKIKFNSCEVIPFYNWICITFNFDYGFHYKRNIPVNTLSGYLDAKKELPHIIIRQIKDCALVNMGVIRGCDFGE